jgi:DNA-binding GntR family transcriptional regulator
VDSLHAADNELDDSIRIGLDQLQTLDTRTIKDQVVQLLREAILAGKIQAGGRLNESQLARSLGLSRIPIREALQQLKQQGLVVDVPRRGKFVINLTEEEIQKINSLRIILEGEALRLCRAKIDAEGIQALNALAGKMQKADGIPQVEAAALDLEFHRTIWKYSGNELLEQTLEGITAPLLAHRVLWRIKRDMLDWASILSSQHRLLLDFVEKRVEDSAEKVMLSHLSCRYTEPARFSSLALETQSIGTQVGLPSANPQLKNI